MTEHVAPQDVGVDPVALHDATDFIEAEFMVGTFPGAALVCTRGRKVFIERYWGTYCSRTRRDNPLGPGVTHLCYSFSKGIAATALAIARQDGLIDYDVPVGDVIPEFKGGGKDKITLRLLLCHAAGIPSAPFGATYTPQQWDDAVQATCRMQVEWEPGSRTLYHAATGVLMAAEIVRRKTGQSWNDFCRERLFEPLGTGTLSYLVPGDNTPLALTPPPQELPCQLTPEKYGLLGHPGGGCFGTISDLLKVLHLNLNKGLWEGRTLIRPDVFRELHTIQFEKQLREDARAGRPSRYFSFGLGWALTGPTVDESSLWFGMGNTSYGSFGHAGIDTVMGIGDPGRGLAILFLTTDSPNPSGDNTRRLRTTVTNKIVAAVK